MTVPARRRVATDASVRSLTRMRAPWDPDVSAPSSSTRVRAAAAGIGFRRRPGRSRR